MNNTIYYSNKAIFSFLNIDVNKRFIKYKLLLQRDPIYLTILASSYVDSKTNLLNTQIKNNIFRRILYIFFIRKTRNTENDKVKGLYHRCEDRTVKSSHSINIGTKDYRNFRSTAAARGSNKNVYINSEF